MVEERNEKSLCEKSMNVVANIIKLSSFSIAKMSLGEAKATKGLVPGTDSGSIMDGSMQPTRYSENRRSKPYAFVMEPAGRGGDHEPMMVREEKSSKGTSDGKFAAYIRKVHEKNRRNSHEASKLSPYIMPPPPTPLRRHKQLSSI